MSLKSGFIVSKSSWHVECHFWVFTSLFFGIVILNSIWIVKSKNNASVRCEGVLLLCREEG